MIHELIDPKKKTNKRSALRNTKTIQNNKNNIDFFNFDQNDCDNKKIESSSSTFMLPWLRSSLGLNQKNVFNLNWCVCVSILTTTGHGTTGSDQKASKIIQEVKEPNENELDSLKRNHAQVCSKELKDQNYIVTKNCPQEAATTKPSDNAEFLTDNSEGVFPHQSVKSKEFESSYANSEVKCNEKEDSTKIGTIVLNSLQVDKLKNEGIRQIKLSKQKQKLRNRNSNYQKHCHLNQSDINFLLKMKAREVLENIKKKDVESIEVKNFQTKLMLLGAKPHDMNNCKVKQRDMQSFQEIKTQMNSVEEFKKIFEHIKEMNLQDIVKSSEFSHLESVGEKKRDEKEDKKEKKNGKEAALKTENERNLPEEQDLLLSTDDEDNIKRFSQFLSKNENVEEKKKCLEEVRNYFEKKRKSRLTKRRCHDDLKKKPSPKSERKEENFKEKPRAKDFFKGKKSKFVHYDETVMEKAVEETLQKFIDLYRIHLSPALVKGEKEPEKIESPSFEETPDVTKEALFNKETKKKTLRTLIGNPGGHCSNFLKEKVFAENEKLNRLKKEFDNFLHSIQFHIDLTNLKLQSIILEKEEQPASSKNVQFVYNFTKKSLDPEKLEFTQMLKETSNLKNYKESGTQTAIEVEVFKRNVKIQALEPRDTLDQSLQTENKDLITENTQTSNERILVRELKEPKKRDVNSGLYRMVKSRNAGRFYLYPEQLEEEKQPSCQSSSFSLAPEKKLYRKKDLLSILSKGSSKDRANKKKSRKTIKATAHFDEASRKKDKRTVSQRSSVNCLYFRNFDKSNSGFLSPKGDLNFIENTTGIAEESEELGLGDAIQISNKDKLGYFWFWNGEKISPGCDLKTHVENLLREKLKEMISSENYNSRMLINPGSGSGSRNRNSSNEIGRISRKNAVSRLSIVYNAENENLVTTEEPRLNEESITNEFECKEMENISIPLSEEKSVKNVATQNSQPTCTSISLSKMKIHSSKIRFPIKKRNNKQNASVRLNREKPVCLKKAEHIYKTIEELKKINVEAESVKKENPRESSSLLNCNLSAKEFKSEISSSSPPVEPERGENEQEEKEDLNFKDKLKKLISLVNCEIQRNNVLDNEDGNLSQNLSLENHKDLEIIETVLNRITHKERENLWNDVRNFIKERISRDLNDDDEREVCIEIEQDLPKVDQGKLSDILAKGHYRRNEGNIEVEIDLTLDDLERILRQRQKKIRRRNIYHTSICNKYLSNSSIQSELNSDDIRRYKKYLRNFSNSGRGRFQEKEVKPFL